MQLHINVKKTTRMNLKSWKAAGQLEHGACRIVDKYRTIAGQDKLHHHLKPISVSQFTLKFMETHANLIQKVKVRKVQFTIPIIAMS